MSQYTLFVTEKIPGTVRPAHVDLLDALADTASRSNAHHLAGTLHAMADGLRAGKAVRVDTGLA
jgi:hypothetical protein